MATPAVLLLLSLTAALGSFWVGRFSKTPEFKAVAQRIQATEAWLKWRFLPNVAEAIATNERKLKRKTGFTASMTGLLVLALDVGGYLMFTFL